MRQVNGEQKKPGRQHPEAEKWEKPEQASDGQKKRQRQSDGKPVVAAQTCQRPAQQRDQAFQSVELPVKPALAP
jgi:hypothetical protein